MNKTLVGIVTYGNNCFTKMAIRSIKETATKPVDIFIVVGKPDDFNTKATCAEEGIPIKVHNQNYGFPYSCNDIYDYAWKEHNYDNLIFMGNDVVVYPNTLDILIEQAETTDYEWIAGAQFDCRSLARMYPETKKWFHGEVMKFDAFDIARPWEIHKGWPKNLQFVHDRIPDLHNLALLKKSVFEKIGYNDVNYYPAYFEDNDYVTRAVNINVKACFMVNAVFFHFWSRTIHQGNGGSNPNFFEMNRRYFITKWGGTPLETRYRIPFDGKPFQLTKDITLPASLKIESRTDEEKIVAFWRSQ
jgi:GT2 family glycosyltransferase